MPPYGSDARLFTNYFSDITGKSIFEQPCPTDPNLLTQDPRYNITCKPPTTSEQEPEITFPVITVVLIIQINVEDHKNYNDIVENGIQQALGEGNSHGANVTKNEVYEQTIINIESNKAYILQLKEKISADLQTPSILHPIGKK
ncbi:MAG: hypothetical protein EZS28_021985 [Streblomastix strix]|uniref:Uncharacterized protein n=1 Tax=Streblomastix strix TaxID=222440 RepID=A0A5J4VJD1_9EUKA|nr:MAG: hypothetical protein EZS28_021985 [Streblomastix strix]